MTDFIDRVPRRFEDVNSNEGINTVEFLEAADGVVMLFDDLGSAAFVIVKNDIQGNIKKVRTKHESNPEAFNTLEKIVLAEAGTSDRTATQGLLWLKRGLEFTAMGVNKNLSTANEELSASFTIAYERTIKQYHNFVVKAAFNLAMRACPSRVDFYKKLGDNQDNVAANLLIWATALQVLLDKLNIFYSSKDYGKGL
ncbi:hypothetical protein LPJ66_003854 [Kickxella alabastrina]|uniref:Uncharacterized protein n=1 Tax=Kickxella alabastrina TaxID=61397 RepID=A0ACC1IKA5_9FUNG|nr:hypothetical protein LPJ66_003854 [Kickxella alabastrina]